MSEGSSPLRAIIVGVMSTYAAACSSGCGGGHLYDSCREGGGNPPTTESFTRPFSPDACVASASPDALQTDSESRAPQSPPAVPTASVAIACELDCERACGRFPGHVNSCAFSRDSREQVDCVVSTPGHPCARLTTGAVVEADGVGLGGALRLLHQLEVISAVAFRRLAEELAVASAPADLIRDALTAAVEEERHAELAAGLLSTRDLPVSSIAFEPVGARSLEAIAIENAVEGCVRETWGALSARHQATHAEHADSRDFFAAIAEDETRHADWSWRVAGWVLGQLDDAAALRVRSAQARAVDALMRRLGRQREDADRAVGFPGPTTALFMARALFGRLDVPHPPMPDADPSSNEWDA